MPGDTRGVPAHALPTAYIGQRDHAESVKQQAYPSAESKKALDMVLMRLLWYTYENCKEPGSSEVVLRKQGIRGTRRCPGVIAWPLAGLTTGARASR